LADYNANIRVSADTKKAESEISKLQSTLSKLSDFTLKLNSRDIGRQVNQVTQQLRGIGERGAVGALALAAGKATTALSVLGSKLGIVGAAAAAAGSTINSSLGGIPGVITDILGHLGNVPTAFGVAAVAAMAFAPQLTKAAASAAGLGAAVDKAVGRQTSQKIATLVDGVGQLNTELQATKASFADLISGSTLNELNSQLRDAVEQSGAFHSSTLDAVTAAEQLVAVQREQAREQKAINDLIRQAQGLQPQDVRNTEVSRRVSALKTRELQQKRDAQLQNQINAELAEYERTAAEVAAQTKQWADNLDRIARSSRAGVLGGSNQIRTRIDEMRQNRNSADIARQRSAELLALEARQRGGNYSLSEVPARGELFPGGNTVSASPQYRSMLNAQAQTRQAAASALAQSERTVLGFQAQTLRTEKDITTAKLQQQAIDQRSIQIARDRNRLLLEQFRAEQRVSSGTLDRASRVADLRRKKAAAKDNAAGYENLALGVGFPLLFGGGPGSILGAAGGSFVGSGFGGQILGGAIGQAIDQFAQSAIQLGAALNSPTEAFDVLKERALISSKELEKLGDKLQEAGFAATASALAQQDINNRLGAQGVRNLQALAVASDDFNRAIAALAAQMQSAMAGPLGGLVRGAANIAGRSAQRGSGESVRANLNGANQANFDRDVSRAIEQVVAQRFGVTGTNSRGPTSSINYLSSLDPKKLQQILDQYGPLQVGVRVNLTPEQIRQELTTTLTKQLEAIDIGRGVAQQVRERSRAQEDLDVQRAEMVMQQERAIGDLRRSIEDRVVDIRLSNLQRENELLDVQAQIRLQSLRNSNIGLRSGFTNDKVSGAANAVADYLESELQVANDAAKIKRDAALEVQRLDIETERFKIQTAIQVSRLNQDTAKQVASIQRNVLRQNQDQDTRRFALEKQIAQLKLDSLAAELALVTRNPGAPDQIRQTAFETYNAVLAERKRIGDLKAPGAASFNAAGLGGVGVSTGGVDAASAQAQQLIKNLEAAKQALLDLVRAGNIDQLKARLYESLVKPIEAARNEAENLFKAALNTELGSLSNTTLTDQVGLADLVDQLTELRDRTTNGPVKALLDQYLDLLPVEAQAANSQKVLTEAALGLNERYIELQDTLTALQSPFGQMTSTQEITNRLIRAGISLESEYAKALLRRAQQVDNLNSKVSQAQFQQQQLEQLINSTGNALNNVLGGAIDNIINKTQSWQAVLSNLLGQLGGLLMQVGFSMLGGNDGKGLFSILSGNFGKRATGGPVTLGSPYLVGERGPELFVPGTGGSVVPTQDLRSAMNGGGAGGGSPVLNMSFQTTNIGGVEYVSRDQLEAAMASTRRQAASDGARRGMSMTLDKLQQSPGTRNRVGLR
jgi:hypothetical protein